MSRKTLFGHAGGTVGLHRLEDYSYVSVLADSLLKPSLGGGSRAAQEHLNTATDGNRHPRRKGSISTWNGDEKGA